MDNRSGKRDWGTYNNRLKSHGRLDIFLSAELLDNWRHDGVRKPGGVVVYRDSVIELCLLLRVRFGLPLRQTEGFIGSVLSLLGLDLRVPDYTTLSRRAAKLAIDLLAPMQEAGSDMVIAVDSTGLSVHRRDAWNRQKHGRSDGRWQERWRKLHICIDTGTGLVLEASYTRANVNDATELPGLIEAIPARTIKAVCGDMAYDTARSRRAIMEKGARQLIPPRRRARKSSDNRNRRGLKDILAERDAAIDCIRQNTVNGDLSAARAKWKRIVGYHRRSLVETAMWRLKTHAGTRLASRTEQNRAVEARLKCKLINIYSQA